MSWDDILGNFIASIAGRTAFYYFQKWLESKRNWSIGIRKVKSDFQLDRFIENGQSYLGMHNGTIALEGVEIEEENALCPWWDNRSIEPRNIYAGGGGNVLIHNPSPNTRYRVKSKGKTVGSGRYGDISPRY